MPSAGLLIAAAAVLLLLLLLALKLRGPSGPSDLTGPPGRRKRRVRLADGRRLHELLEAGDREGALRLLREIGQDEAEARRLLGIAERIEAASGPAEEPARGRRGTTGDGREG